MPENPIKRITERLLKSTFYSLRQTEQTLEVIKGLVKDEIPGGMIEKIPLSESDLDPEIRFGVKKRKSVVRSDNFQ